MRHRALTLLGIVGIAAACSDVVSTPVTTAPAGVDEFHVAPAAITLAVGSTATLTATSSTGVAVAVIWSSSDTSVVKVTSNGTVTAIKSGTVTIVATSKSDPTVKGASAVTVGQFAFESGPSIAAIDVTNAAGQTVPANLNAVSGKIIVTVSAPGGEPHAISITVIIKSGTDSLVQTQVVGGSPAGATTTNYTFNFDTAQLDPLTGARILHNGMAMATSAATSSSSPQDMFTTSVTFTLANPGGT